MGERGNYLCLAQKHIRSISSTPLMPFAELSYTMQQSTHGVTGINGGKGKYPLNISQKKKFYPFLYVRHIFHRPLQAIPCYDMRSEGYPHKWKSCRSPCPLCQRKRGKSFTFIFSGVTHSRKSGNCTDAAGVRRGITYTVPCKCCMKKWRCFSMRNPKLVPYETTCPGDQRRAGSH